MNTRLVFGVGAPGLVLILLFAVSSMNPGLVVQDQPVGSLPKASVFPRDYAGTNLKVLTRTVRNNFFLPRAEPLPGWKICVAKGDSVSTQGFSYQYVTEPLSTPGNLDREIFTPDDTTARLSVPAHGEKTVYLYIQNQYRGNFGPYDKPYPAPAPASPNQTPEAPPLPDFDTLLLIPDPNRRIEPYMTYSECSAVSAQQATYRIPLT